MSPFMTDIVAAVHFDAQINYTQVICVLTRLRKFRVSVSSGSTLRIRVVPRGPSSMRAIGTIM